MKLKLDYENNVDDTNSNTDDGIIFNESQFKNKYH